MKKEYFIITNNPQVKDLITRKTDYELQYIEGDVQAVITACEMTFQNRGMSLAADPMAGRRARPFSCLTVILEKGDGTTPVEHWERIADYSQLNSSRQDQVQRNTDRINEDYRILDCSFTKAALKLF